MHFNFNRVFCIFYENNARGWSSFNKAMSDNPEQNAAFKNQVFLSVSRIVVRCKMVNPTSLKKTSKFGSFVFEADY